jgi:cytochrome c biogenesis protein CcdA/thiol-disulfide isomerase/thioredoxin
MRRAFLLTSLVLIAVAWAPDAALAQGGDPVVKGYLFYSSTCPDCQDLRIRVVPGFYQRWGEKLQLLAIDISVDSANLQWLEDCATRYGVPTEQLEVPALFVGTDYMIGTSAVEDRFPALFDSYSGKGGVDYPDVSRPGDPLQTIARFVFFYSPTCPHCQYIEETILPRVSAKYGTRVQWDALDISLEANLRALLSLGGAAGLPEGQLGVVPVVFIGDEYSQYSVLVGAVMIESYLEPALDWFLAIGGVGLPGWWSQLLEQAETPIPSGTASPSPDPGSTSTPSAATTVTADGPEIHLAYFAEAGCGECDLVSVQLDLLRKRFPNLVVHKLDIIDDLALNVCLCDALGVPSNQRHDAPAVFVGSDYLVGSDVQYDRLVEMVAKYAVTGAGKTWEACDKSAITLPAPPPWWAVIVPGLADGINPCAFATIVFLVSYLAFVERKPREILLVGLAFTIAVFLSYLSFGLLLREVLAGLIDLVGPVLRPILNAIMAVMCLVMAFLSVSDFVKARQGRVTDMTLRLPDRLRKWINATIRRGTRSEALVAASFASGVVVSFIELACTGQVYVPIIQGLSNPVYRAQSTLDLVVYCIAFVIPLVVVFTLSFLGTTSQQLGLVLRRFTPVVKLLTAMLFLGISVWLVFDALRISGIITRLRA